MNTTRPLITIVLLFALALAIFSCNRAGAQTVIVTNAQTMPGFSAGLQMIYDSVTVSTNYAVIAGAVRSTTGSRNIGFVDYAYNFSQNVGLVLGYDYCTSHGHASVANLIKGGISLQASIAPFKQFGITNFCIVPFGSVVIATGNGVVGEIVSGGAKAVIASYKGFNFNLGALYESRTGEGYWDGRYVGGFVAASKGF